MVILTRGISLDGTGTAYVVESLSDVVGSSKGKEKGARDSRKVASAFLESGVSSIMGHSYCVDDFRDLVACNRAIAKGKVEVDGMYNSFSGTDMTLRHLNSPCLICS